jgi:hypothetical protein
MDLQAPAPHSVSASDTGALHLSQVLENRQAFRCSALWIVHSKLPPDLCAKFLLSAPALENPLERLVAGLSMQAPADAPA